MTALVRPLEEGATGPAGSTGPAGPAGPTGPQGPAGSGGDLNYVFYQLSASALWHIVHSLGKFPDVVVIDSGGNNVIGTIDYIDMNTLDIVFSAPFGGTCYLN